jgi:hypothetical protein
VAAVLVTNYFCRFGVPQELHSVQGNNFQSHLIQVLQLLGMSKTGTTPLHPKLDIVEHIRRTEEHQSDYDARLLIFLLFYRASTHDTTCLTPASLVFRRKL